MMVILFRLFGWPSRKCPNCLGSGETTFCLWSAKKQGWTHTPTRCSVCGGRGKVAR